MVCILRIFISPLFSAGHIAFVEILKVLLNEAERLCRCLIIQNIELNIRFNYNLFGKMLQISNAQLGAFTVHIMCILYCFHALFARE